ncbi:hypothetical protein DV515_00018177, partial [Chloebia gouldiae]
DGDTPGGDGDTPKGTGTHLGGTGTHPKGRGHTWGGRGDTPGGDAGTPALGTRTPSHKPRPPQGHAPKPRPPPCAPRVRIPAPPLAPAAPRTPYQVLQAAPQALEAAPQRRQLRLQPPQGAPGPAQPLQEPLVPQQQRRGLRQGRGQGSGASRGQGAPGAQGGTRGNRYGTGECREDRWAQGGQGGPGLWGFRGFWGSGRWGWGRSNGRGGVKNDPRGTPDPRGPHGAHPPTRGAPLTWMLGSSSALMASTGSESSLCSPSAGNRDFWRRGQPAPRHAGAAGVAGVAGTHQELQEGFGVAEQRLGQVDDAVQVPTRVRGRGARAGGERQPRARPQPRPQPQQRQQRPPRSPCGTRTRVGGGPGRGGSPRVSGGDIWGESRRLGATGIAGFEGKIRARGIPRIPGFGSHWNPGIWGRPGTPGDSGLGDGRSRGSRGSRGCRGRGSRFSRGFRDSRSWRIPVFPGIRELRDAGNAGAGGFWGSRCSRERPGWGSRGSFISRDSAIPGTAERRSRDLGVPVLPGLSGCGEFGAPSRDLRLHPGIGGCGGAGAEGSRCSRPAFPGIWGSRDRIVPGSLESRDSRGWDFAGIPVLGILGLSEFGDPGIWDPVLGDGVNPGICGSRHREQRALPGMGIPRTPGIRESQNLGLPRLVNPGLGNRGTPGIWGSQIPGLQGFLGWNAGICGFPNLALPGFRGCRNLGLLGSGIEGMRGFVGSRTWLSRDFGAVGIRDSRAWGRWELRDLGDRENQSRSRSRGPPVNGDSSDSRDFGAVGIRDRGIWGSAFVQTAPPRLRGLRAIGGSRNSGFPGSFLGRSGIPGTGSRRPVPAGVGMGWGLRAGGGGGRASCAVPAGNFDAGLSQGRRRRRRHLREPPRGDGQRRGGPSASPVSPKSPPKTPHRPRQPNPAEFTPGQPHACSPPPAAPTRVPGGARPPRAGRCAGAVCGLRRGRSCPWPGATRVDAPGPVGCGACGARGVRGRGATRGHPPRTVESSPSPPHGGRPLSVLPHACPRPALTCHGGTRGSFRGVPTGSGGAGPTRERGGRGRGSAGVALGPAGAHGRTRGAAPTGGVTGVGGASRGDTRSPTRRDTAHGRSHAPRHAATPAAAPSLLNSRSHRRRSPGGTRSRCHPRCHGHSAALPLAGTVATLRAGPHGPGRSPRAVTRSHSLSFSLSHPPHTLSPPRRVPPVTAASPAPPAWGVGRAECPRVRVSPRDARRAARPLYTPREPPPRPPPMTHPESRLFHSATARGERNPPRRPPDTRDPPGTPPDTEGPPRTGRGGAGGGGDRRRCCGVGGRRGAPGAHLGRGGRGEPGAAPSPHRGYRERRRARSGGSGAELALAVPAAGGHRDRCRTWSRAHLDLSRTWTGRTGSGVAPGPGVPGSAPNLARAARGKPGRYRQRDRTWTGSSRNRSRAGIGPALGSARCRRRSRTGTGARSRAGTAGLFAPEPGPHLDQVREGSAPGGVPNRYRGGPDPEQGRGSRSKTGGVPVPLRVPPPLPLARGCGDPPGSDSAPPSGCLTHRDPPGGGGGGKTGGGAVPGGRGRGVGGGATGDTPLDRGHSPGTATPGARGGVVGGSRCPPRGPGRARGGLKGAGGPRWRQRKPRAAAGPPRPPPGPAALRQPPEPPRTPLPPPVPGKSPAGKGESPRDVPLTPPGDPGRILGPRGGQSVATAVATGGPGWGGAGPGRASGGDAGQDVGGTRGGTRGWGGPGGGQRRWQRWGVAGESGVAPPLSLCHCHRVTVTAAVTVSLRGHFEGFGADFLGSAGDLGGPGRGLEPPSGLREEFWGQFGLFWGAPVGLGAAFGGVLGPLLVPFLGLVWGSFGGNLGFGDQFGGFGGIEGCFAAPGRRLGAFFEGWGGFWGSRARFWGRFWGFWGGGALGPRRRGGVALRRGLFKCTSGAWPKESRSDWPILFPPKTCRPRPSFTFRCSDWPAPGEAGNARPMRVLGGAEGAGPGSEGRGWGGGGGSGGGLGSPEGKPRGNGGEMEGFVRGEIEGFVRGWGHPEGKRRGNGGVWLWVWGHLRGNGGEIEGTWRGLGNRGVCEGFVRGWGVWGHLRGNGREIEGTLRGLRGVSICEGFVRGWGHPEGFRKCRGNRGDMEGFVRGLGLGSLWGVWGPSGGGLGSPLWPWGGGPVPPTLLSPVPGGSRGSRDPPVWGEVLPFPSPPPRCPSPPPALPGPPTPISWPGSALPAPPRETGDWGILREFGNSAPQRPRGARTGVRGGFWGDPGGGKGGWGGSRLGKGRKNEGWRGKKLSF